MLQESAFASTRLRQSQTSLLSHPSPSAPASRCTTSFCPPMGAALWFLFLVEGTKSPNRRTENEIRTNQFSNQQRILKHSATRQLRGIACWHSVSQRRLRAHRPAVPGQLFVQRWAHRPQRQ